MSSQIHWQLIFFGFPTMAGVLLSFFRIDQLLGKPFKKDSQKGRSFSGRDAKGEIVCVEPDGRAFRGQSNKSCLEPGLVGAVQMRGDRKRSQRVSFEWVDDPPEMVAKLAGV